MNMTPVIRWPDGLPHSSSLSRMLHYQ